MRWHTVTVRVLRVAVPVICVLLLVTLLVWPSLNPDIADTAGPRYADLSPSVIREPRFFGADGRERQVRVAADLARQLSDQALEMDRPRAQLDMADGVRVVVSALSGAMDQASDHLSLNGGVVLEHSNGLQVRVRRADVDTDARLVWSVERTRAASPLGELTSAGFRLHDEGKRIEFTGPVHLTLHPEALAGEQW